MSTASKRWQDFTPTQQKLLITAAAAQLALLVAALWDLSTRPASEINGRKGWWVAASFVNFAGPIAYFLRGRKQGCCSVSARS